MQSFVESRAFITSDRAEVVDTVFGKSFTAVVLLKLFSHMLDTIRRLLEGADDAIPTGWLLVSA